MSFTNVSFVVPGVPQGKGRAKIVRIAGFSRMATPQKTVAYEGLIAVQAQAAMQGSKPWAGPVAVEVDLVHVVPASWPRKKRESMPVPVCKPDADNVAKAVGDGCNGVLWLDDRQIALLTVRRMWGDRPEVRVRAAQMVTV